MSSSSTGSSFDLQRFLTPASVMVRAKEIEFRGVCLFATRTFTPACSILRIQIELVPQPVRTLGLRTVRTLPVSRFMTFLFISIPLLGTAPKACSISAITSDHLTDIPAIFVSTLGGQGWRHRIKHRLVDAIVD